MPTRRIMSLSFFNIFINAKVRPNQYPPIHTRTSHVYYASEALLHHEDDREHTATFMVDRPLCPFSWTRTIFPRMEIDYFFRDVLSNFGQEQRMILRSGLRTASIHTRRDGSKSFITYYSILQPDLLSSLPQDNRNFKKRGQNTVLRPFKCDFRDDIPNSMSVGESSILSFDESLRLIYSTRQNFPNGIRAYYNIHFFIHSTFFIRR